MRRGFRDAGWGLVAIGVVAVSALVTIGAIRAHGDAAFDRWVGWATIDALPLAAIGIVLVVLEKISRTDDREHRRAGATEGGDGPRGVQVDDGNAQTDPPLSPTRTRAGNQKFETLPDPVPGTAESPGNDPASAIAVHRTIGLWGLPGTGKTTYLAALNKALAQASPLWKLNGATEASARWLSDTTALMVGNGEFPPATQSIDYLGFVMTGEIQAGGAPGGPRQERRVPVRFDLKVIDPSGELARTERGQDPDKAMLIRELAKSDGIIFFFDPVREAECGDAYETFMETVHMLEYEMGPSSPARLPHHVAVCIAKFDEPRVFSAARESGYLVRDKADQFGFPRIADDRTAEKFFDDLCRNLAPTGTELLSTAIRRYFFRDHIKYFAISSAGFYLSESMNFDPDDYYNLVIERLSLVYGIEVALRGPIYPINVLEPMLWLAAPDLYEVMSRRRAYARVERRPREGRGKVHSKKPQASPEPPGTGGIARPEHLICMIDTGGTGDEVRLRIDRLCQLVSAVTAANPMLRVSLVSYGAHSVSRRLREEPVNVHAWAVEGPVALRSLEGLSSAAATERAPAYRRAAQIECALAEVARRLTGQRKPVAVVTVGDRPAFPPRMASDLPTLPCPLRTDWETILRRLRHRRHVTLGAIVSDGAIGEIWTQLGAQAIGASSDIDIRQFAANLGLLTSVDTPDTSLPAQRNAQPDYDHWHEGRYAEDPQAWPPLPRDDGEGPDGIPLNWDDE